VSWATATSDISAARIGQRALHVALLSFGYLIGGIVGTALSVPPSGFAIFWPATSILTAAFIVTPRRLWWTYPLGVVPAHFLMLAYVEHASIPLVVALTQLVGNFSIAAVTATVLQRASKGAPRFDSFRGVLLFIILADVVVPAVLDPVILAAHLATGWAHDFWLAVWQWILGDIFPTITITPVLVLIARKQFMAGASPAARMELATLCAALFGVSFFVFGKMVGVQYWPTLLLMPLPLLLWAAIRRGVGGTCLTLLAFAGAIIVQALRGLGPFAAASPSVSVVSLQVFLAAAAVPLLLLSALMEERERTKTLLRRSEERTEMAAASTDTGLWQWDEAEQQLWMTEHCRTMFDLPADGGLTPEAFLDVVHEEDQAGVRAALRSALKRTETDGLVEFRVWRDDGELRWLAVQTHAERDRAGHLVRLNGAFRDVTQRVAAQQETEELSQRLQTLQDDERKNIAEELHESTGQHLAAVRLNVQALRRRTTTMTPEMSRLFDEIQATLMEAGNELRVFTYLLRPAELEQRGLRNAVEQYVSGFSRRTGLICTIQLTPQADDLPVEEQHALLRVVQESLANVHRHAAATRVSVRLRRRDGALHLVVTDDGHGFRTASGVRVRRPAPLGVGIPGMTARIRQLGGRITFRSNPKGTVVHVALPLNSVREVIWTAELHGDAA
jgi:signal transduction histidine kinase